MAFCNAEALKAENKIDEALEIVNSINEMTDSHDQECVDYCKECRDVLKKERKNLHYLIKRQQLAARLILISPTLHRKVYHVYYRTKYEQ